VALLDALYAFYQKHERWGDLDSGLDGDRVWMACTCGAVINSARTMTDQRGQRRPADRGDGEPI